MPFLHIKWATAPIKGGGHAATRKSLTFFLAHSPYLDFLISRLVLAECKFGVTWQDLRRRRQLIVCDGGLRGTIIGVQMKLGPKGEGGMSFSSPFVFRCPSLSSPSTSLPPFDSDLSLCPHHSLPHHNVWCIWTSTEMKTNNHWKECCQNEHKGNVRMCVCCSLEAVYFSNNVNL